MAEASRINIDLQARLIDAAARSVERRRGHFSFLTWPFFLAQIVAADQFFGDALRPALAADEAAKTARFGSPEDGPESLPPESHQRLGFDEEATTPARDTARAGPLEAQLELAELGTAAAKEEEIGARGKGPTSDSSGGAAAAGGSAKSADAAGDGTGAATLAGDRMVDANGTSLGSGSPPSLLSSQEISADVTSLFLGSTPSLAGNPVGSVATIVESTSIVASTTTDAAADLVGTVVDAVGTTTNIVSSALTTAEGAIGLTDSVLESIEPIVESTDSTLSTGTSVAAGLANGLLDGVGSLTQTTGSVLTSAAETAAETADGLIDVVDDVAGTAGSLLGATTQIVLDGGEALFGATEPLVQSADSVLARATDDVADLAATAWEAVAGSVQGADNVLATTAVTELAGDVIYSEAKLDQLQSAVSPPKAAGESALVEEVGDAPSLGYGLASSGALAFDQIPPLGQIDDNLLGSTSYSQYGVAISSGAAEALNLTSPESEQGGPEPGALDDGSAQQVADKQDGTVDAAATSLVSDATKIVDDIGLRSIDNLL